ncbi:YutD family protein [Microaerobacter geothermalis]|uniref:YutD family protein n=1 Tax=Microaerobacter geothermalis TaxID=674972 RepID=UPI001F2AC0EE|nr:YutD family protein [Microaerobacter geothermalis]MCF6092424.1 YutD family protein [Microaerobacter geothermalis]
MIHLLGHQFEIIKDFKNGWNAEAFRDRYSDVLDKYDYIVGDWGYGQLRLKGFYDDKQKSVPFENRISAVDEYIQEYCNFGCAYFVLKKIRPLGKDKRGNGRN